MEPMGRSLFNLGFYIERCRAFLSEASFVEGFL